MTWYTRSPIIEPLLLAYIGDSIDEVSTNILEDIGWQIASLRGNKLSPIPSSHKFSEFLKKWLLRELDLIVDATVAQDYAVVSIFRFSNESAYTTARKHDRDAECAFLRGYIQVLMSQSCYFTCIQVKKLICCSPLILSTWTKRMKIKIEH